MPSNYRVPACRLQLSFQCHAVHVTTDPSPQHCSCLVAVPNSPPVLLRGTVSECSTAHRPLTQHSAMVVSISPPFLPASLPWTPLGMTHCLVRTHTPIPNSHHQSPSGQIAAAVRQMSDDWACYLSACMTMGLWAEIERQKLQLCHTCA